LNPPAKAADATRDKLTIDNRTLRTSQGVATLNLLSSLVAASLLPEARPATVVAGKGYGLSLMRARIAHK
jgi:hypothetical protein